MSRALQRERVGNVLRLERRPVKIEPHAEYTLIGVYSFGKGIFHRDPKPGTDIGDYRFFEIRPGDLVLSNIQAWEGAIAYADEGDASTIGTHRFLTYVPVDGRVDAKWAHYFFLSDVGSPLIQRAAPGSVTRNRTLAIDRFEALEIPMPPIDEQRRVVDWLDQIGRRATRLFEISKRGEPLGIQTAPGVIDSLIGRHSNGAQRVRDVVVLVSDIVRPGDDPAPADTFVGLQHIESHTGRRIGEDALGDEKGRKFRFAPGDIVYGYLRPYLNKVWVADCHGLCSVDQYVLRPTTKLPAKYIAYALRSRSVLDEAIRLTHSLQLPRLRSGLLLDLEIRVPQGDRVAVALEQLERANGRVVDLKAAFRARMQHVEALKVSALNHAFFGL